MVQEITGHYVMVENTRIYYDECGKGIPFCCVHSAGASSLLYRHIAPILADKGFRVIVPDLPGHGKSFPYNWEPFTNMHQYAEFYWKIIKAIIGTEKPIVNGCAIGGDLVVDLACYHSKDCRAIIAMQGAAETKTFPDVSEQALPHACPGWQDMYERATTMAIYYPCPPERVRELKWQHRYCSQPVMSGDSMTWLSQDCKDKIKDIKCPIMLFKGEADFYVPEKLIDETLALVPDGLGEKFIGKKVGHYPVYEEPEYAANLMIDFLKRKKVI